MKPYHALVLLLAALLSGATQAAQLEDFLKPTPVVDVQISPDGKHLAMLRRDIKDTLYVVRRTDNKVVNGISSSTGQRFHSFIWANANRLLIEPAIELNGERLASGSLLGFSIDGERNGFLHRSAQAGQAEMYAIVNLLVQDPEHVLVAKYFFSGPETPPKHYARKSDALGLTKQVIPILDVSGGYQGSACADACNIVAPPTLEKLNIYTGETSTVATAPSRQGEYLTDAHGERLMFTGIDSGVVSIFNVNEEKEWQEISFFTQHFELGATPIGFDRHGNVIALDNLVDTLGISQLTEDGEVRSLFRDTVADINSLVIDRAGTFLAASFVAGYPSWYYHDSQSQFVKTHEALRAAYPDSDIAITSFTDDQSEALVRVYSDRNPGTYYVVNLETRKADTLLAQIDWIEDEELVLTEPIQLTTRDQFEIYGYITLPTQVRDTPPVIVMTHRHPFSARFEWGYDAKVQMFANAGYAVLQINTRGSPGYGQRYTTGSEAELDNWTDRDLVDALRWATEQELIDPTRVCLFGSGRGAYSALITAIRNPEVFKCVVAADGRFGNFNQSGINPARKFAVSLMQGRDASEPPWYEEVSQGIKRLRTPTLIVQEDESPQAEVLASKTRGDFVQHAIGITNLNRVTDNDALVTTYKRVLEFIAASFSTKFERKDFNKALHELLSDSERRELQAILSKVYQDLQRATRERDSNRLPSGFERNAGSPEEKIRRAKRAIRGRDREVRRVLPEEYWQAYESFQQNYEQQVTQSIEKGRTLPRFTVPGSAGR